MALAPQLPGVSPATIPVLALLVCGLIAMAVHADAVSSASGAARQLTRSGDNHILTNCNIWSPDSKWIVYDIRSPGPSGGFDGQRIERVNVDTGEVQAIYHSGNGAYCGVVTCHPLRNQVVFILGPEHPTPDFTYGFARRHGVIVDVATGRTSNLDARDLAPPFTPGALRGGSHVHVFSPDGQLVSFTYEDHVLDQLGPERAAGGGQPPADLNQRGIGVSLLGKPVRVDRDHPRNHDGEAFTVLVTRTVNEPRPGSDEISKAFEEGWVGTGGYVRPDGTRQRRALAFQGNVVTAEGRTIAEVFVVDLPDDLTLAGDAPLEGTATRRPAPPRGTTQRRLTFTAGRAHPGIQGPRHWLRSSPDGSRIATLMKDDAGIVQIWLVSPNGGEPVQLTHNPWPIASAFTWDPTGELIAHVMDNSVCVTDTRTGRTMRLTPRTSDDTAPTPDACVVSPDGRRIAYTRPEATGTPRVNQVYVVDIPGR